MPKHAGSNWFAPLVWLVAVWIVPVPLASRIFAQVVGESREPEVVVGALNADGMPITGLAAADFRVSDPRRGTITSAEYRHDPSAKVVVLLDESGSMSSRGISNKWKVARDAASAFVSLAPSTMQLSMMSFRSSVVERFEASNGRKPIQDWLATPDFRQGTETGGGTSLYDTMLEAIRDLSPAQRGDAIYVITDATDNTSKARLSLVERSLRNSGIRLFAFLVYSHEHATEGPLQLSALVRRTGGFAAALGSDSLFQSGVEHYRYGDSVNKAIQATTRAIQAQISDYYILHIGGLGNSVPKRWNFEVLDTRGHRRKDISLTYAQWPRISGQATQ